MHLLSMYYRSGACTNSGHTVQGAFCGTTDEACDTVTSTCNGRNEMCHGRGPAWPDDTASTRIIAQRQADAVLAQARNASALVPVRGRIEYR